MMKFLSQTTPKYNKDHERSRGFTIVELMIATAVFSVVLLLCATAVVQVGQIFYKGVTINRTQDTARKVADDIIQSIQFGAASTNFAPAEIINNATGVHMRCLGTVRYTFLLSKSLGDDASQSYHVLVKDRIGGGSTCNGGTIPQLGTKPLAAGQEELLGQNMRLSKLNITQTGDIYTVSIGVAYGKDDDLFEKQADGVTPNYEKCVPRNIGGQFCAVSTITTSVTKRL